MKKTIRFTVFIVMLSLLSAIFTGCDFNELRVMDSLQKNNEIKSMESSTELKMSMDLIGASEEELQEASQMLSLVNNSSITINQKTQQDKEKIKGQVDLNIDLGGMITNTSVWVDADTSIDNFKLKEIIKLPPILMMSMPEEDMEKEYFVLDFEELMQEVNEERSQEENIDMSQLRDLVKFNNEFKKKFNEFLKEFAKDLDFDEKIIKYKGIDRVDGASVKVYELKIDDKTFKRFIKQVAYALIESDSSKELLHEYFTYIEESIGNIDSANPEELEELKGYSELFNEGISKEEKEELLKNIDEVFESFKDIQIIGEKGIVIQLKINKKGYIVNTSGNINIAFDVEAFNEYSNEGEDILVEQETIPTMDINIEFDSKITNINKDIYIKFPKTTSDNSINYMEVIKAEQEPRLEDTSDSINIENGQE
jgi:hypothetical protein